MTGAQAETIVQVLAAAYPQSKKIREPGTEKLYASFLRPFDFDAASAAVRDVIGESKWWPTCAELKRAYEVRLAAMRRVAVAEREREEREQRHNLPEQTDAERQRALDDARAYMAKRWGS